METFPVELVLFILFCTGLLAGLIDSIAGGGGLITVPVLLAVGLPPQIALGTNKLQSSFGSCSAMLTFIRSGKVHLRDCYLGITCTAIGAAIGAISIQMLDPSFLKLVIPWLLLTIAVYTILTPRMGFHDIHPRMPQQLFFLLVGSTLGFYDGFFGPGTGSFWVMLLIFALGFNMTKATAYTKVMNFTSNAASLLFFIAGGSVLWREGLIMGAGQFIGGRIGARMVISKGTGLIRPLFITMVLAMTASLIWKNYSSRF